MGEKQKLQLNEHNEWRSATYENSRLYKEKVQGCHDRLMKQGRKFLEGEQVLLYNAQLWLFSSKLNSRWSRPYTVTNVSPQGVVEISHTENRNFKVNGY